MKTLFLYYMGLLLEMGDYVVFLSIIWVCFKKNRGISAVIQVLLGVFVNCCLSLIVFLRLFEVVFGSGIFRILYISQGLGMLYVVI